MDCVCRVDVAVAMRARREVKDGWVGARGERAMAVSRERRAEVGSERERWAWAER